MGAWLAKLLSSNDVDVSVLHVVLVFAVMIFAAPVLVVVAIAIGYGFTHAWALFPDFGQTVRACAESYGVVTGSTGVAWALKGGAAALQRMGGNSDPH